MANKGAYTDFTGGWEKLITNVIANAAELPDLSGLLNALQKSLDEVKARDARQQSRRGVKQQESKELREQLKQGENNASKLRAALKSHYGFANPRLHEYGIKPLGRKKRRKQEPEQPEQPKPEEP
jgi:septal ring factor EnvC (AmiA/AmiB activator)